MYPARKMLLSKYLKSDEMKSVLPMFHPNSEKAKKVTARLRRAEKMNHLIPFLLLLGFAVLWLFSRSVSNQELTLTTKYVPIRNKTATSGMDEWGATIDFEEDWIENANFETSTEDMEYLEDMEYFYDTNEAERVEETKKHEFGNEESARIVGNKKDEDGKNDWVEIDEAERDQVDGQDGGISIGQAGRTVMDRKEDRSSTTEDSGRGTDNGRDIDQIFFDDDEIDYDSLEEDYMSRAA